MLILGRFNAKQAKPPVAPAEAEVVASSDTISDVNSDASSERGVVHPTGSTATQEAEVVAAEVVAAEVVAETPAAAASEAAAKASRLAEINARTAEIDAKMAALDDQLGGPSADKRDGK